MGTFRRPAGRGVVAMAAIIGMALLTGMSVTAPAEARASGAALNIGRAWRQAVGELLHRPGRPR